MNLDLRVVRDECRRAGYHSRYSHSLRAGRSGVRNLVGKKIFLTRPDGTRDPLRIVYSGYWDPFPGVKRSGNGINFASLSSAEIKIVGLCDLRVISVYAYVCLVSCSNFDAGKRLLQNSTRS